MILPSLSTHANPISRIGISRSGSLPLVIRIYASENVNEVVMRLVEQNPHRALSSPSLTRLALFTSSAPHLEKVPQWVGSDPS